MGPASSTMDDGATFLSNNLTLGHWLSTCEVKGASTAASDIHKRQRIILSICNVAVDCQRLKTYSSRGNSPKRQTCYTCGWRHFAEDSQRVGTCYLRMLEINVITAPLQNQVSHHWLPKGFMASIKVGNQSPNSKGSLIIREGFSSVNYFSA